MTHPDKNDVVIRLKHGNPSIVFLLGTHAAPDQFILRTRDEAVSQALAYAKHQHVRAWFAKGNDTFVLLGTFREEKSGVRPNERGFTMAKVKTAEKAATIAGRQPESSARPATVTTDHTARRAYDLYVARGREDGHDVEDWMQAERELQEEWRR